MNIKSDNSNENSYESMINEKDKGKIKGLMILSKSLLMRILYLMIN